MFKIEIVERDTNEVVKTMTAETERSAERIERGVLINLNHEAFFARVTESD